MKVHSKYKTLITQNKEYEELCLRIQERNSILFYGSNSSYEVLQKYFNVIKIENIDLITIASQRIIPDIKFIGCFIEITEEKEFNLLVDMATNLYMSGINVILRTDITLNNIFPTNCIITNNEKNMKKNMSCINGSNIQVVLETLFQCTSFRPEYSDIISPKISNKEDFIKFINYIDTQKSFNSAIDVSDVADEFIEVLINRNIETIVNNSENKSNYEFQNSSKLELPVIKNFNQIKYKNKLGFIVLNILKKIRNTNNISTKPKVYLNNVSWEFVDLYFKVITRKFDYINYFENNKYNSKEIYNMKSTFGILNKLKLAETNSIYPSSTQEVDINPIINLDCNISKTIIYIGDELTYQNIKSYSNVINISYEDSLNMENILNGDHRIDMLFVESCWRGKNNSWRNIVNNCSTEIVNLINLFKEKNIPVVFMAKEDPVYFNTFKNVASICDIVITTSQDMIIEYEKINKNVKIMVEQYFINEQLFNPYICTNDEDKIFFAGGYYPRFIERTEFLKNFSSEIGDVLQFDIYDRNYGKKSLQNFPSSYDKFIVGGSLNLEELVKVTSNYKYSLNLSSIVDDNTMIARRIFEQIALGKVQISNYSKSLENLRNYAIIFNSEDDISKIIKQINNSHYSKEQLEDMALNILGEKSTYTIMNKLYEMLGIDNDDDLEVFVKDRNEITLKLLANQTKDKRNKIVNEISETTIIVTNNELEDRHLLLKLLIKGEINA